MSDIVEEQKVRFCGFTNSRTQIPCTNLLTAKGFCMYHYNMAKKLNWPMPCPEGFSASVNGRGRPKKSQPQRNIVLVNFPKAGE
jgi:hypothetical protein